MSFTKIALKTGLVTLVMMSLTACAGMTTRGRNTAIGTGVGAVAGNVLTDSTLGTVGGAAIGGVVGNQWNKR
jgi:osmotically inducible lipoprotein OsmB